MPSHYILRAKADGFHTSLMSNFSLPMQKITTFSLEETNKLQNNILKHVGWWLVSHEFYMHMPCEWDCSEYQNRWNGREAISVLLLCNESEMASFVFTSSFWFYVLYSVVVCLPPCLLQRIHPYSSEGRQGRGQRWWLRWKFSGKLLNSALFPHVAAFSFPDRQVL